MRICQAVFFLFVVSFLFSAHPAGAQITVEYDHISVAQDVSVTALDSASSAFLPGVIVTLAGTKDTTIFETNNFGFGIVQNAFIKDSVLITASLMGYRTLSLKTVFDNPSVNVRISMPEDPEELNAIIVKADAVLMVSKGDTVVYNTEILEMMEGDNLAKLLAKLPGVSLKEDKVYAGGREVNKILVNGSALFGSNISAALTMIESDNVKKVRVYDEHAQDRLIEGDTLKTKDHVLDVVTKENLARIRMGTLDAALGIYTDKNDKGLHDPVAALSSSYRSIDRERPNYYLDGRLSKNYDTTEPIEKISTHADINRSRQFRDNYLSSLSFNLGRRSSESSSEREYLTMDRYEAGKSGSTGTDMDLDYSGTYAFNAGKDNMFKISGNFGFKKGRKNLEKSEEVMSNGVGYRSDMTDSEDNVDWSARFLAEYRHLFAKSGREFSLRTSLPYSSSAGGRYLVDTMQTATYPQWMDDDISKKSFSPEFYVSYSEPLIKESLYMNLSLAPKAALTKDRRLSFDRLLMQDNGTRSYDYTYHDAGGDASVRLSFRKGKASLNAGVAAEVLDRRLRKNSGNADSFGKTFFNVCPTFEFNWQQPAFNATLKYEERADYPGAINLRNEIDYANPLFLTAGNPDLRPMKLRTASLSLGTFSFGIGTSWEASVSYTHNSDIMGNNTRYFDSDVYLEEYGYKAMAGSRLVKAENIGNGWQISANLASGFFLNPLKSNFRIGIGSGISRNPVMTDGKTDTAGNEEISCSLSYNSAFSEIFGLTASTNAGFGNNKLNNEKVWTYSKVNLSVKPRLVLFKCWETTASYNLETYITDREGTGYEIHRLDVSTGYIFGKTRQFKISLDLRDALNSNSQQSLSVTELYIRCVTDTLLGRSAYVSFHMTFK